MRSSLGPACITPRVGVRSNQLEMSSSDLEEFEVEGAGTHTVEEEEDMTGKS